MLKRAFFSSALYITELEPWKYSLELLIFLKEMLKICCWSQNVIVLLLELKLFNKFLKERKKMKCKKLFFIPFFSGLRHDEHEKISFSSFFITIIVRKCYVSNRRLDCNLLLVFCNGLGTRAFVEFVEQKNHRRPDVEKDYERQISKWRINFERIHCKLYNIDAVHDDPL